MISMIALLKKLFALPEKTAPRIEAPPNPAVAERRGQRPMLRSFPDIAAARAALAAAIEQAIIGTRQKQANRSHWLAVGDIEMGAIRQVEAIIASLSDETHVDIYVHAAHQALESLADRYRLDDSDADGFGLGTVHAVKRTLETYDGL